jgi:hypothetical protein
MTLHPPLAGFIAATELGHKNVLSPAPAANRDNKNSGRQQQHVSAVQPFITDRLSKSKFLVDTGSDLSVYTRRLIP